MLTPLTPIEAAAQGAVNARMKAVPSLAEHLDALDDSVHMLVEACDFLATKIDPVLLPSDGTAISAERPVGDESAVAARLVAARNRVDSLRLSVGEIIERVQL